ncbi:MAG: DUF6326 family protein [Christensenellales bacterium]
MTADIKNKGMDTREKLSLLWIFVLFNIAYADILSLMDAASPIRNIMAGASLPSGGLLAGAGMMETSIIMVLLSRVLSRNANRWANIIMGLINMVCIVTGGHGAYYLFFASMEVAGILLIIWFALTWPKTEGKAVSPKKEGALS